MLIGGKSEGAKKLSPEYFTLRFGNNTGSGKHPCPFEEICYILRGQGSLTVGNKT